MTLLLNNAEIARLIDVRDCIALLTTAIASTVSAAPRTGDAATSWCRRESRR
ncbi:MAG TPA: hypothetical protein VGL70_02110 [Candidatus Binatia bacterium]